MFTIVLLVIICIVFLRVLKDSPKHKGKRGESHVHHILSRLSNEYTILNDVVLKTTNGTTQIDHIVVSKYGVFAVETKNYRGEIYGSDNSQDWTQIIVTNVTYRKKWWKTYSYVTKNHFYNPVKQSLAHMYVIKKTLKDWSNIKVVPIVVFAGSAVMKGVNSQYHVIYSDMLLTTIQKYDTPLISEIEVEKVVDTLIHNDIRDQVNDRTHIHNVNFAKQRYNSKIASGICPLCGGSLVRRSGRYGSFYGCSNYPKCKFHLN
ncbi:MAG: NERD domain-containing protein [Bacteroidales bacterium]|nr:NERD domain-containing protein [Bacteroidales bacterium]